MPENLHQSDLRRRFIQKGVETCDDGNKIDGDSCSNSCKSASCGDGITQAGEQCDDKNADNKDACLNDCTLGKCGDGFVRVGIEECDDGNAVDSDLCTSACVSAKCGDGIQRSGVEQCDDGNRNNSDACLNDCASAKCGDGVVLVGKEQCDDANAMNSDGCTNTCKSARCGDGFIQPPEQCDDANTTSFDGCDSTCRLSCVCANLTHGSPACKGTTCSPVCDSGYQACDDGTCGSLSYSFESGNLEGWTIDSQQYPSSSNLRSTTARAHDGTYAIVGTVGPKSNTDKAATIEPTVRLCPGGGTMDLRGKTVSVWMYLDGPQTTADHSLIDLFAPTISSILPGQSVTPGPAVQTGRWFRVELPAISVDWAKSIQTLGIHTYLYDWSGSVYVDQLTIR